MLAEAATEHREGHLANVPVHPLSPGRAGLKALHHRPLKSPREHEKIQGTKVTRPAAHTKQQQALGGRCEKPKPRYGGALPAMFLNQAVNF